MSEELPIPKGKRDLTRGSLQANLLRLALPIAAGTILHAMYSMWDAFWLGKVSKEALTAPAVSMPIQFVAIAFGFGFASAGTALVSQYTGAGSHREADRAAAQTILILAGLITAVALPAALLAPQLLWLFQVPAKVRGDAAGYLRIVMLGMPLMAFVISYGAVLRALGDTITVVIIGLLANIANVALDPILIMGWGPIPALGVNGAALATLNARLGEALICLWFLRRGRAGLHVRLVDMKPDWAIIRRTLRVGFPAALSNSSNSIGFAVYQVLVNKLGVVVISAVFIGFRVLHFFRVPAEAMALAAAPIVGQGLGAGRPELARRAVRTSVRWVACITLPPVILLILFGRSVAGLFVDEPEVIAEAGRFFLLVPLSSYFFGLMWVLTAAFYGSGHTRPVLLLSVVRLWGLRIPLALLLGFVLKMGSLGVYTAMASANVVASALALWLFTRGEWESAVIHTGHGSSEELEPEEETEQSGEDYSSPS